MEVIMKYKANDGTEFDNGKDCIKRDKLIIKVENIMLKLKQKPSDEGLRFANGEGFIQQDKGIVLDVKLFLLEICQNYIDHEWIEQTMNDDKIDLSYVGRLISDYNIGPLNSAWYRLQCIDKEGKEFGQPYFAIESNKTL